MMGDDGNNNDDGGDNGNNDDHDGTCPWKRERTSFASPDPGISHT